MGQMTDSLLPMIVTDELAAHCAAFERLARMYWDLSWSLGAPPDIVTYAQRHAAVFYAESRRVRAEAIKRSAVDLMVIAALQNTYDGPTDHVTRTGPMPRSA